MLKNTLTTGLILSTIGVTYWILLLLSIPDILFYIISILVIFLWGHRNYTVFLSNRDYSLLSNIVQLYGIPLLIIVIGAIGKYFDVSILSMIFSIYFMPFIDISILIFRNIFSSMNYLVVPLCVMFSISLFTTVIYNCYLQN